MSQTTTPGSPQNPHWTDELHALFVRMTGTFNRPDVDARFMAETGVKLDSALFPLLSRMGVAGPIGTVDLAGMVARDHSTVSRQVAKLEELGLIARTPSREDGRIRLLEPTAAGRKMIAEFNRTRRRLMEAQFSDWSDSERTMLVALLKKLVQGVDAAFETQPDLVTSKPAKPYGKSATRKTRA